MDQLIDIKCIPIKLEFDVHPTKVEYSEKISNDKLDVKKSDCPDFGRFKQNFDTIEISDGPHITPICTAKKGVMNNVRNSLCKGKSPLKMQRKSINEKVQSDFNKSFNEIKIEFQEKPEKTIIPASIEYRIAQYPDVIINYIGDMLYVPPSANPNYEQTF